MKILYVTQFYPPERVAAAFRAYEQAKSWTDAGEEVTIFTAYPNFPTGKIFEGYQVKLISEEYIDGIKVIRNKIVIKENTNKIKRGTSALSFLFFSLLNIIFNGRKIGKGFDIVLGTSGTIFSPIIALVYSKIHRIPFVLELRDITYRQVQAVYNGKETLFYYLIKSLELYLCKRADKVVVVTNGFKEELILAGIDPYKIEVIRNGVNVGEIGSEEDEKNASNIDDAIVLSYFGNIGASQNLTDIIDFFSSLDFENMNKKLIIIGDGAKKEDIKKHIVNHQILDIEVLNGLKQNELEKYYVLSHFCIVSLNNTPFFKDTIPSKIFQIMGRKRPILFFGPEGEASGIIQNANSGIVYTGIDMMSLAKEFSLKINRLIKNRTLAEYINTLGLNGYQVVSENFCRDQLARNYIHIFYTIKN